MSPDQPLTARQVRVCESSATRRCRCRCEGRFHGTARSSLVEYFEKLSPQDPHRIKPRSRQLPLPAPIGAF